MKQSVLYFGFNYFSFRIKINVGVSEATSVTKYLKLNKNNQLFVGEGERVGEGTQKIVVFHNFYQ